MSIEGRAPTRAAALSRGARALTSSYAAPIARHQERVAYLTWLLKGSNCDRARATIARAEARQIDREVAGLLERLDAEAGLAPEEVQRHSRVGDVRKALTSIRTRLATLTEVPQ